MKIEVRTTLLHAAAGIALGYISFLLGSPLMAAGLAVLVGVALRYATNFLVKEKKGLGWWLGNGGMVYLFTWFVVWVLALNLL